MPFKPKKICIKLKQKLKVSIRNEVMIYIEILNNTKIRFSYLSRQI